MPNRISALRNDLAISSEIEDVRIPWPSKSPARGTGAMDKNSCCCLALSGMNWTMYVAISILI